MMETDITKSAESAVWVETVTLTQEELTEFAQQITYRHSDLERPVRNHHTDPELAQAAGFEKPVAEPLHYLALFDQVMLERYRERWLERGEFQATVLGPVFAGDPIELRLGPPEKVDLDGSAQLRHRFAILGATGNDVLTVGYLAIHEQDGEQADTAATDETP